MFIRSLYTATKIDSAIAPFDTLHLKVFYPAIATGSEAERMSGVMKADPSKGPMPIVIFFSGINLGAESYAWLAMQLAERGIVTVLFNWVGETLPGVIGLTVGVDIKQVMPNTYGSGPTTPAISAIHRALCLLNVSGPLAGALALNKIVLGGHSAGGTMVLQNAEPRYFNYVVGGFCYAGHTMAATMLGWPAQTVLPCSSNMPLLMLGGTRDGVIAVSSIRYGNADDPALPLRRTFENGISGNRGDRYFALIAGANHFTLAHPVDDSAGRSFLDLRATCDEDAARGFMANLIEAFIYDVTKPTHNPTVVALLSHSLVSESHTK